MIIWKSFRAEWIICAASAAATANDDDDVICLTDEAKT